MKNELETADKGARLANFIVDTIVFIVVYFLLFVPVAIVFPDIFNDEILIVKLLPLIIYFLYYFLFEYLLGKTPGKYLTKTLVINRNGDMPGFRNAIIRTVARLIPFDIISYVFGLTGLHDVLSKTIVVKKKRVLY